MYIFSFEVFWISLKNEITISSICSHFKEKQAFFKIFSNSVICEYKLLFQLFNPDFKLLFLQ